MQVSPGSYQVPSIRLAVWWVVGRAAHTRIPCPCFGKTALVSSTRAGMATWLALVSARYTCAMVTSKWGIQELVCHCFSCCHNNWSFISQSPGMKIMEIRVLGPSPGRQKLRKK